MKPYLSSDGRWILGADVNRKIHGVSSWRQWAFKCRLYLGHGPWRDFLDPFNRDWGQLWLQIRLFRLSLYVFFRYGNESRKIVPAWMG